MIIDKIDNEIMHKRAPVMLLIIFAAIRKKTIKTITKTETN